MALIECKDPIIDRRVELIIRELENGKDKETIAEEIGYTNPVSLDNYMRSRNFAWESRKNRFVPAAEKYSVKARNSLIQLRGVTKATLIISLFTEDGADPRDIAEQTGFISHNDMANYMKRKGYEWDVNKGNYVKTDKEEEEEKEIKKLSLEQEGLEDILIEILKGVNDLKEGKIKRKNGKEEIGEASEIPRYFIPGFYGTKAVRMNHVLDNMITSFSEEKNMSQKEIVEVAIVEFFLKYGDADLMNEYMD